MKILFCVNKDIYCLYSLNQIIKNLSDHQIKIYFSDRIGSKPRDSKILQELQNLEQNLSTKNIAGLLDLNEGKVMELDDLIKFSGAEILNFKNINQDGLEYLETNWTPDLIVSIRFGQIFKGQIISLPKFGIINLHSGILPNYQGIMATFWTMRDGREEIGCTLHFVQDSSIDSGDIIEISRIAADYEKPLILNVFNLYKGGIQMIIGFVKKIENNLKINTIKQDKNVARYFSYPSEEEIKLSKINLI